MRVSVADMHRAFDDLLSGAKSREDIAAWASHLREEDDVGQLHFEPKSAEMSIWKALEYLMGVDLRVSQDEYLHCTEDFRKFFDLWRKKVR